MNQQITFEEMIEQYWEFAQKTFDTKPEQAVFGLKREADELKQAIEDEPNQAVFSYYDDIIVEGVDVLFYLIYILKRRGFTTGQIAMAMKYKLAILKNREWEKGESGCYHTVREAV